MKAAKTKYDTLNYLLGQYGVNNIDSNTFWNQMKQNGWGQDDIDQWCAEYYRREQEKEDEREKANGTTRTATARYERGSDFKEQSADRQGEQDRQGREGRTQTGQAGEEAKRSWPVTPIWITLTQDQINWIDKKALARQAVADAVAVNMEGRAAEVRWLNKRDGYRAEAAVRLFFGTTIPWSILDPVGVTGPKIDFSDFIDVKNRMKTQHRLVVNQATYHPQHAYLLVCGTHHPRYRIVGWCWGHEIGTDDRFERGRPDREPSWWMKEDDPLMKDPFLLRDLALSRIEERVG